MFAHVPLEVSDLPPHSPQTHVLSDDAVMTLSSILLILAFIAFVAAAVGWGYKKTNLLAIGLALWVLSIIVTQVHLG